MLLRDISERLPSELCGGGNVEDSFVSFGIKCRAHRALHDFINRFYVEEYGFKLIRYFLRFEFAPESVDEFAVFMDDLGERSREEALDECFEVIFLSVVENVQDSEERIEEYRLPLFMQETEILVAKHSRDDLVEVFNRVKGGNLELQVRRGVDQTDNRHL